MSATATSEPLVSRGEIESVLAEAAAAGEQIPSLDDALVAVPVELPPLPRGDTAVHHAADPPDASAAPSHDAVDQPSNTEPGDAIAPPRRIRTFADVVYLALDGTLGLFDLPFRRVSRELKTLIFAASATSLTMSVAAALTFPMLFPPPDPAKAIHAKALAAEAARHAAAQAEAAGNPATESAGGESTGGHEAAPAHGEAPKPPAGH